MTRIPEDIQKEGTLEAKALASDTTEELSYTTRANSRQLIAAPCGGLGTPFQPHAGDELPKSENAIYQSTGYLIDNKMKAIRETHLN